jgi:class 3 adenylate cyclase
MLHPSLGEHIAKGHQQRLRVDADRRRAVRAAADAAAATAAADRAVPRRPPSRFRALGTVLFTDIVASTETARALGDGAWRGVLEEHNRRVDELVACFDGRRVKQTGDGVLCLFTLPGQALRCAEAMHRELDGLSLRIRIGIHTGEIELLGDDITGLTVHVAARVLGCAAPGETWTSSTVRDLVFGDDDHVLADEGVRALRGVGDWQLCRVARSLAEPAGVGC